MSQTLSSGTVIRRGKTIYGVIKRNQPSVESKNPTFEVKYSNISDKKALQIANSMSPEDQHSHRPFKKKHSLKNNKVKSFH